MVAASRPRLRLPGLFAAALTAMASAAGADICAPTSTEVREDLKQWYAPIRGREIVGKMGMTQALDCLNSLEITAPAIYHTLQTLEHGVLRLYSYKEISVDSTAGDSEVAAGCELPVHDIKVNMVEELHKMRAYYTAFYNASDFEDLRAESNFAGIPANAFEFHERLTVTFARLKDKHTVYIQPYSDFYSYEYDGRIIGLRIVAEGDGARVQANLSETWEDVTSIDGQDPFSWVKAQADRSGTYKSAGVRVNSFLNLWAQGYMIGPLPRQENTTWQLANSGPVVLQAMWLTMHKEGPIDGEIMTAWQQLNASCTANKKLTQIQKWLREEFSDSLRVRRRRSSTSEGRDGGRKPTPPHGAAAAGRPAKA